MIAGRGALRYVNSCLACIRTNEPKAINKVTVGLAIVVSPDRAAKIFHDYRNHFDGLVPNEERLKQILQGDGVGSQLWKILESIQISHRSTCPCMEWAERMNAWGPKGCQLARREIVEHMKASAKNYGWGDIAKAASKAVASGLAWKLSPLDPFGSLLDEAIRRSA